PGGTGRGDRDKAGQVLVLRAQPVERPGAERGTDELERAGVQLQEGLRMRGKVRLHGANDAEIVRVPGDLGKEVGYPKPALSVLRKLPLGSEQLGAGPRPRCAAVGAEL